MRGESVFVGFSESMSCYSPFIFLIEKRTVANTAAILREPMINCADISSSSVPVKQNRDSIKKTTQAIQTLSTALQSAGDFLFK